MRMAMKAGEAEEDRAGGTADAARGGDEDLQQGECVCQRRGPGLVFDLLTLTSSSR